jgi:hypothetical protein
MYNGVYWNSRDRSWQIKAANGPGYTDQVNRQGFRTEFEAAVEREIWVVKNGWQKFNTSDSGYPSNAKQLNEILPPDQQLPAW